MLDYLVPRRCALKWELGEFLFVLFFFLFLGGIGMFVVGVVVW